MVNLKFRLLFMFMLLGSAVALAAEQAVEEGEQREGGQRDGPQSMAVAPLALDRILVSLPTGLSYDQEVMLRIIRQGYQAKRSKRDEDRDVLICWLGQPRSFQVRGFLYCARNGDLRAQRLRLRLPDDVQLEGWDGYGNIQMTTFPVKRRWLEDSLAALPGSDEFDVELISMRMAGERPPLEIPDDAELARFVPVWHKIGRLDSPEAVTETQTLVIESAGFTVHRYRHISKLVNTYQSIKFEVDNL